MSLALEFNARLAREAARCQPVGPAPLQTFGSLLVGETFVFYCPQSDAVGDDCKKASFDTFYFRGSKLRHRANPGELVERIACRP